MYFLWELIRAPHSLYTKCCNSCRCIVVITTDISGGEAYGYARANLTINEVVLDNTPDYEVFDTLYLTLVVEDINQVVGVGNDTGQIFSRAKKQ